MKFDKCMEYLYKVLCLLTVAAVVIGCITSCAMRPVTASAVEISAEEELQINDFLDASSENLGAIDFQFSSDEDGNRNVRLKIYALQNLALQNISSIYDNLDLSAAPDTVSISGSCVSGFYRTSENGDLKTCTLFPVNGANDTNSYLMATSSDFNVICTLNKTATITPYYEERPGVHDPYVRIGGQYSGVRDGMRQSWHDEKGYLADYSINYGDFVSATFANYCYLQKIPVITRGSNPSSYLCGLGSSVELPVGTVDTETPWDYYNTILLPYMEQEFPGYDEYFVFPDGYQVPEPPYVPDYVDINIPFIIPIIIGDPLPIDITDDLGNLLDVLDILAELLPDGGLQFNIDGVTITFPRDADNVVIDGKQYPLPLPDLEIDGHTINLPDNTNFYFDDVHFVINADGTITIGGDTYTLPIGTPTQVTSDYVDRVYEYEIPTMERLNIVDAEIEPVNLSEYSSMISGFWGLGARLYADLDLVNVVIACLSISAIGYAISKIGGH